MLTISKIALVGIKRVIFSVGRLRNQNIDNTAPVSPSSTSSSLTNNQRQHHLEIIQNGTPSSEMLPLLQEQGAYDHFPSMAEIFSSQITTALWLVLIASGDAVYDEDEKIPH